MILGLKTPVERSDVACARILPAMEQQQENPIHWDQNASKWNLTLIFSLVVVVLGFAMGFQLLLIVLGVVMAGYSWLTTPRQYLIYRDSVVVIYGMPRTRVISFAEISHVELLAMPLGERLRVRMVSGSRVMLMMRDPGAFRAHLEDALAQYHREQSGVAYAEGTVLDSPVEPDFDMGQEFYALDETASEVEQEVVTSAEPDLEPDTASAGSYTEADEPAPVDSEVHTGRVEQASSTSGSYTESAEPDFSGEGRPMYGADVEFETTTDEDDRPESPY